MVQSKTGNATLDDMTEENFGNYHKEYEIGRENGEYFFQRVGENVDNTDKISLKLEGDKLVREDSFGSVEYEIQDGQLIATYPTHRVAFERK